MEYDLHAVSNGYTVRCIGSVSINLNIGNIPCRSANVTYLLGNSRDIILIYLLFCLNNVNIIKMTVLTGKADICISCTVRESNDYIDRLNGTLYGDL